MAKLSPDQLHKSLSKALSPIYLVSGDESLLVSESVSAIRKAARAQGFSQHEIHHAENNFQWDTLMMSANSLSLFAEKKIIELRIRNGKPGDAGSKALVAYCQNIPADTLLIIVLPKLDKRTENSKWHKQISQVGDLVTIWPVGIQQLPRWIEQRLAQAGLHADRQAIDILCAKVEGNLLAAVQEVEKLKLLSETPTIDANTMASVVMDSARYNVFDLIDKALSGDARACVSCLAGLRAEGTSAPVILWALANQLRTLTKIKEMTDAGTNFDAAANQARVWKNKLSIIRQTCQRLRLTQLQWLLRKCALTDAMIKGAHQGDEWNEMLDISLGLAGIQALNQRSQKTALLL